MTAELQRIREEIDRIRQSALRLCELARHWPSVKKNAEIILIFAEIVDFLTPMMEVEDGRDTKDEDSVP